MRSEINDYTTSQIQKHLLAIIQKTRYTHLTSPSLVPDKSIFGQVKPSEPMWILHSTGA